VKSPNARGAMYRAFNSAELSFEVETNNFFDDAMPTDILESPI
jgi:hypothetical protein